MILALKSILFVIRFLFHSQVKIKLGKLDKLTYTSKRVNQTKKSKVNAIDQPITQIGRLNRLHGLPMQANELA